THGASYTPCDVLLRLVVCRFFFFQAEDGIRDFHVTGVQTCALPILLGLGPTLAAATATLAGALAGRFRFGLLFAGGAGRPGLLLAPAGRGLRLLATALAATTRLARLAHLRRLRLQAGQVEAHRSEER